jgi:hypothetical protein
LRHDPCQILSSEPHLLSNVVNGPASILTGELLNSCTNFRSCTACGSPCVFVIANWCATGLEPSMSLKHLRTTQDLVSEVLLNHCESFRSTFPKIGTKFDAHSMFLSLIHRENRHRSRTQLQINECENCPCPASYVQRGTLLTRHGSRTIYRRFVLPQLLYRWRHKSGIFWIPPRIWYLWKKN